MVWKLNIESTEQCSYRFIQRYKVNSDEERTIYICNRSGEWWRLCLVHINYSGWWLGFGLNGHVHFYLLILTK